MSKGKEHWAGWKEKGITLTDSDAGPYGIQAVPPFVHKYFLKWYSVWEQLEGQPGK